MSSTPTPTPTPEPTPTPTPDPTPEPATNADPNEPTAGIGESSSDQARTIDETGASQLLSTATSNGLPDPYADQGGWRTDSDVGNPYAGSAVAIDPYTGNSPVDPYTDTIAWEGSNAFTGGAPIDPFSAPSETYASNGYSSAEPFNYLPSEQAPAPNGPFSGSEEPSAAAQSALAPASQTPPAAPAEKDNWQPRDRIASFDAYAPAMSAGAGRTILAGVLQWNSPPAGPTTVPIAPGPPATSAVGQPFRSPAYDTAAQAGYAALRRYNALSIQQDREIGGLIYEEGGKYYHTLGVLGPTHQGTASGPTVNTTAVKTLYGKRTWVGDWHTHGGRSSNPVYGLNGGTDSTRLNVIGMPVANPWTTQDLNHYRAANKSYQDSSKDRSVRWTSTLATPYGYFSQILQDYGAFPNPGGETIPVANYYYQPELLTPYPEQLPLIDQSESIISDTTIGP